MHAYAIMQNSTPCEFEESYTLVVLDSERSRNAQTSQDNDDVVTITITNLMANTGYWYHVIATNQFGSSQSTPVEICKWLAVCRGIIKEP